MVKGLDVFQRYFGDYTEQYVLIGGSACSISFDEQNVDFGRTTKDLDMVLIVEAQTEAFGKRFWQFIKDGGYRNRAKSNGRPQFYRFDKPDVEIFPKMIELFSRADGILKMEDGLTPIHIDDSVSSLSAILLNDSYYQFLLEGRYVINGLSTLRAEWIIPFKAKAWLDLSNKVNVDSSDVKKHRNDIIRIASEMKLDRCVLPAELRSDMNRFINDFRVSGEELKNLKIRGVTQKDIIGVLRGTYL